MADDPQSSPMDGQFSDAEDDLPRKIDKSLIIDCPTVQLRSSEDDEDDMLYEDSDDELEDEYDNWNDHSVDGKFGHNFSSNAGQNPNKQLPSTNGVTKVTKFQPTEKVFKKFVDKINIDKYEPKLTSSAVNKVLEQEKRGEKER